MLPDYKHKNNSKNVLSRGTIKVKVIFVFVFLLSSLVFTQLVFANNLATGGQKLSSVQKQIRLLEDQNTTLKTEIAKASSLTNLYTKANALGFKKPSKLTIL